MSAWVTIRPYALSKRAPLGKGHYVTVNRSLSWNILTASLEAKGLANPRNETDPSLLPILEKSEQITDGSFKKAVSINFDPRTFIKTPNPDENPALALTQGSRMPTPGPRV